MTQVCTVIPAKNSAPYLAKTLESLSTQTIENHVIVVDDGSSDKTSFVAKHADAEVIQLEDIGKNMAGTPHIAKVINTGLKRTELYNPEYLMIAGSDDVFPSYYIEKLLENMNQNVVLCSGYVQGERYPVSPRGGGRLIKTRFFKRLGYYPICYGWETYPIIKAKKIGLQIEVYPVPFISQRSSSRNPLKNYYLGRGMKALGYTLHYALARAFQKFVTDRQAGVYMLQGYFHESHLLDVAKFWSTIQKQQTLHGVKRFMKEGINLLSEMIGRLV